MIAGSSNDNLDEWKIDPILGEEGEESGETGVVTIERTRFKRPQRYKVLLHNDDYTTMEFVIYILQKVFGKHYEEAKQVMLDVHQNGRGVCGVYTHEIAETKMTKVKQEAKENGHPLKCSMEPE
ncbi:ATP-dependent Clp protease adapter ClpS [Halobacteriovorax sp. GB3]|uniref:ATP-dependent Clp protease adapter ClpS n=1 Tax=Halobacteriovorax sp. GB3 TaxID=2719615 RepID=UPI002361A1FF|nr:ATP-dependent Clp protease adapter ClpS [Halobacteriovorax sp. GB3]MDD0853822.1 ATP-dependent Clp protease adapter ClpS [Halobacteriovorax sp. GB3]